MVSYCCVKGCGNNSNNKKKDPTSLISFHAFPSNWELKSKWLRAIGRPNWIPPNYARICSAHFVYDQINYDGCRKRIKDDALPVNLLPLNSNFEASNVEACRVCLATDLELFSLQGTQLGICMESVAGSNANINIDGLPKFICYQCKPNLIKCSELIDKCTISQAKLLDIFAKNGEVTKTLIKEHSKCEIKLLSNNSGVISNLNSKKSESNDSDVTYLKNENHRNIKIETNGCKIETNELMLINNTNSPMEHDITDDYFGEDSSADQGQGQAQKIYESKVKHMRKKVGRKKDSGLTPDETDMLKYFNIVELSLQEQIREWTKSTVRRRLTSETVYQCEVCNKMFANADSYRVHTTYHNATQGQVECPICKLRFKTAALAASHSKRTHSKKFFCKMCPKAFNNVGVAKKHQRWHSGYLYKCGWCPFRTKHESSLGVHRRGTHGHGQPGGTRVPQQAHTCPVCARALTSARGLDLHMHKHRMLNEKDITKKYPCEQCDIGFTSENARRVHVLTSIQHVKKPGNSDASMNDSDLRNCCKKCGQDCGSFKDLVQHNRLEHTRAGRSSHPWRGDAPYPISCELCGETISTRKKHWLHVRRYHPKEVDTYQPVITAVCDTCGKGYQNTTKLRLHKLRHRSPTVRCQVCPRMFYDKYALMRHARTHSADKPYQCRICGKAFKVRSNLDRHARVHTDAAPYECTMCGKKFKHSSSVNLHVRTVHYKLPQPPRKKRSKSAKDENTCL